MQTNWFSIIMIVMGMIVVIIAFVSWLEDDYEQYHHGMIFGILLLLFGYVGLVFERVRT